MTLYDSMVESYAPKSALERQAVQQEVMQLIALSGLARGGFFERAVFYGGTCLHLFYGMERFSEDMDFSLLAPDPNFDFESYFPAIKEEFALAGKEVEIQMKHKGKPSSIDAKVILSDPANLESTGSFKFLKAPAGQTLTIVGTPTAVGLPKGWRLRMKGDSAGISKGGLVILVK